MMAPASSSLSVMQRAVVAWINVRAGAAGEPIAWHVPALTEVDRAHLSGSLRRLEARGLLRRLSPSLTPHAGRTGVVELTEASAVLARLCHHSLYARS
jgi:hypothetical protein